MAFRPKFANYVTALGVIGAGIVLASGCRDSDLANVSGTVIRKDGTPLVGAKLIARSRDSGVSAIGTTDEQGKYTLVVGEIGDGIPPGDYYVLVVEFLGDPDNPTRPTISTKYVKPSRSGLQFNVQAGDNKTFDMSLDPP